MLAMRNADGPMSTPRRPPPRSRGTPIKCTGFINSRFNIQHANHASCCGIGVHVAATFTSLLLTVRVCILNFALPEFVRHRHPLRPGRHDRGEESRTVLNRLEEG